MTPAGTGHSECGTEQYLTRDFSRREKRADGCDQGMWPDWEVAKATFWGNGNALYLAFGGGYVGI